jgi:hypothetical protein
VSDISELLSQHNIKLPSVQPGRYYVICPQCSAKRKKAHQKLKVLGVTVEIDKVFWGCNHCGWTGPEKGARGDTYDYRDRAKHKSNGKYYWDPGEGDPGLYRIDEALETDGLICVVEGEKDVNSLWQLGIAATCGPHGANTWKPAYSKYFLNRDIVVLNDNDKAGYEYAAKVISASRGFAKSIRRLDLKDHWSDMPEGADVSDFIGLGTDYADLLQELIECAPYVNGHTKQKLPWFTMTDLEAKIFNPLKWIIPHFIPEGLTLLAGKPKTGKSWFALATQLAVARNDIMLGETCVRRTVLNCALEDVERRLQQRTSVLMNGQPGWPSNAICTLQLPDLDHGCIDTLKRYMDEIDDLCHGLIIIDTLAKIRGRKAKDEEPFQHDHRAMSALADLAHHNGLSILVIHHLRKSPSDDIFDTISGTTGLPAGADTIAVLAHAGENLRLAIKGRDVELEDRHVDRNRRFRRNYERQGDHHPRLRQIQPHHPVAKTGRRTHRAE